MSLLQNSNAIPTGETGYTLTDSVRFRLSASAVLTRTPSTTSNRRTWTYSLWIKLSKTPTETCQLLYGSDQTTTTDDRNFQLRIQSEANGSWIISRGYPNTNFFTGTTKLRDPSAWYHIVFAVDTTQATASNRMKLYINGVEDTQASGSIPQNQDTAINWTGADMAIGGHTLSSPTGTGSFNGYMTEVNFVDGQALTPSDFGEYDDDTGVWKPKRYTGSYGTNGFHLPMSQTTEVYSADYLIVAGGGSGGHSRGGGGGAGGLLTGSSNLVSGTTYSFVVGAGGAASSGHGNNGSNSTGLGLTAIGGGGGGSDGDTNAGNSGGSGGGGAGTFGTHLGGSGTTGQGNAGGSSYNGQPYSSGGGGGAGAVGANGTSSGSGNGGIGIASSITGTSTYYAGGGGAGRGNSGTAGTGGLGGGGNGGAGTGGTSATANTGGGGGGGGNGTSGAGGSGVVILSVPTTSYTGTTTGSPTVTTNGSNTIIKFTSNGSYTA